MVEVSVRKCSIKHRRFWNEMAVLEENDCVKRTRDWTWRREKPGTPKQNGTQVGARFWECNIFAPIYVAKKCQCHIIFWCAEYHEGTTVKHKFIEALPVYSVIATTTSKVSNAFSSKVCVCVCVRQCFRDRFRWKRELVRSSSRCGLMVCTMQQSWCSNDRHAPFSNYNCYNHARFSTSDSITLDARSSNYQSTIIIVHRSPGMMQQVCCTIQHPRLGNSCTVPTLHFFIQVCAQSSGCSAVVSVPPCRK
jgi:hypothetical protein